MVGTLEYNFLNERYGLTVGGLWGNDGFHCGDCLEVWDGDSRQWISTSIEVHYPGVWYLTGTAFQGSDLDGLRVRVKDY